MEKNKLLQFTKNMSKFLEVFLLGAACLCLLGGIVSALALSPSVIDKIKTLVENGQLTVTVPEIVQLQDAGEIRTGVILSCLSGMVVALLGGMIFRNISLIFKNTEKTHTPFTKKNVKLIRNIGRFALATPFVSVICEVLTGIFCHISINAELDVTTLVMGLVILCLSQFFEYGVSLEDEVEGMI